MFLQSHLKVQMCIVYFEYKLSSYNIHPFIKRSGRNVPGDNNPVRRHGIQHSGALDRPVAVVPLLRRRDARVGPARHHRAHAQDP